jgi:hypothetical protein
MKKEPLFHLSALGPRFQAIDVPGLLRAFTARTGALVGAVAAVTYLAGGFTFDVMFGRPSPDQWAGNIIFGLPILGVLFLVPGVITGSVVQFLIGRARRAEPVDRRAVGRLLAIVAMLAALAGVGRGIQIESRSPPRVMISTGAIGRHDGPSAISTATPAMTVFEPFAGNTPTASPLSWNGAALRLMLEGNMLTIRRSERVVGSIDLRPLDYVTEIFGTTGMLDANEEWLALLVRLRSTGHRDLLLIYDPTGILVHEELLERTGRDRPLLLTAGERGQRQEFLVDVGQSLRFAAVR